MKTPIADFIYNYNEKGISRFHMPGHKGKSLTGAEKYDITEVDGADVLYSAEGIINESENNASLLFGTAHSFFSSEGSTLAIKAMLSVVCSECEDRPLILAARNAHKAFLYAAALIDFEIQWMYGEETDHLCKCTLSAEYLEKQLSVCAKKPAAVYITSPDYLGNMADVKALSEVCDKHMIPLLVDNAHGAYLAFTRENMHPINLGASMCCDSAHKTLPCLTGGAYLHVAKKAEGYCENARGFLSLFASTSPSYLILQSLDLCNRYISDGFSDEVEHTAQKVQRMKSTLTEKGFIFTGDEPLKIVIDCNSYGYSGCEINSILSQKGIGCEYYDRQYIVFMLSPCNKDEDFEKLARCLLSLEKKQALSPVIPSPAVNVACAVSPRKALFSKHETVSTEKAEGRICADPSVSCPPAVPIVSSGEIITKEHIKLMEYYGICKISVIK